jgi:GNAT superfamily N-acetyltransferase
MAELTFTDIAADGQAALATWYDLRSAVQANDRPSDPKLSRPAHDGLLRHPWPGEAPQAFLVHRGGRPVGWYALWLSTTENLDTAPTDIEIHPEERRRGFGRAVLEEAIRQVRALGRIRIVLEAVTDSPGAALLTDVGARAVLHDTQRALDLEAVDVAELDRLLDDARAHSAGYSLVQWVGPTPVRYAGAVGELESRMTTDAPFDDLAWEQEVFDAERILARDAVKELRGMVTYSSAARHDESGTIVGMTSLVVYDGVDDAANQWETIVLPDHRGHRLGMLLKIENLRHLQRHEPTVTRVETWNADSNAPMLAVNVAMGFRPLRQWAEWELVVTPDPAE